MKLQYISQRRQLVKSYYTGIGKTAVIFPSAFLVAVGAGLIQLGLIFYLRDIFRASPSEIGLLAALWSLAYIAGCIFIRPLFDRILPRNTIMIASFSISALTFLIHFVNSLLWIYILYALYGLSNSLFWPPLMGWLSRKIEGVELSKTIGKFNLSWSLGLIISPFLAGWLSERSTGLPLYFGSSLYLLTGFMVLGATLVLPAVRRDREIELPPEIRKGEKGKDTPLRYPAWIGVYISFIVVGVILVILPVSARTDLSMSKTMIGLLLLSRALFMTVGFLLLGRTTFWHFKSLPALLGQACLAISLILLVYIRSPLSLGLALALTGLVSAFSYSNSIFHGASGSTNRAKRMGIHEALLSAGLITGSFMGGIIYQRYSMTAVYWFCLVLVSAGIAVQAGLSLRIHKTRTPIIPPT